VLGDQAVGHLDKLGEAGLGRSKAVGAYQFHPRGEGSSGPVDVLADVEKDDQHAVETHAGQPLAEGGDAIGVVAFQVVQTFLGV
jgi:hypothetical protein